MKLIREQQGVNEFYSTLHNTYQESVYVLEHIKTALQKSECKKIGFEALDSTVAGLSLVDRVVINTKLLSLPLNVMLYIIFHEIAHQYQYKKYGINKMYGVYTGDITIKEGAEWMKKTEMVADQYSVRKLREISNKVSNRLNLDPNVKLNYDNVQLYHFIRLIEQIVKHINKIGYTSKEDISSIIYNYVKQGMTDGTT